MNDRQCKSSLSNILLLTFCFPAVLLIAGACGASELHRNSPSPPAIGPAVVSLGDGFDSTTGRVVPNQCVEFTKLSQNSQQPSQFDAYYTSSEEKVASRNSLSMAAAFGIGIYSGSATSSAIQQSKVNSYSSFAVFSVTLPVTDEAVNSPVLKVEYKKLIEKGRLDEFRQQCGDSFISTTILGARYSAFLSVSSKSDIEQRDHNTTLSFAVSGFLGGGGSLTGSQSESFDSMLTSSTEHYGNEYVGDPLGVPPTGANCGGFPKGIPSTFEEMKSFATLLSCRATSPRIIDWGVYAYPIVTFQALGDEDDVSTYMKILTRIHSLQYFLANNSTTNEFGASILQAPVRAELADLSAAAAAIQAAFVRANSVKTTPDTAKQAGNARTNESTFKEALAIIANGHSDPLYRIQLLQPTLGAQNQILVSYSPTYPSKVTLTGPVRIEPNGAVCPGNCVSGVMNYFLFQDQQTGHQSQCGVRVVGDVCAVPANSSIVLIINDGQPPHVHSWFDGNAGVAISEDFESYVPFDKTQALKLLSSIQ